MSKKNGPKVAIVGGGSYIWTPQLVADLMRAPEVNGAEIVLLDPNIKAAEEVMAACKTIGKELKSDFRIRATSSETSAFRDADFVMITISTGGLKMMARDLKIPEKYGIFHTVGDSIGPAGWNRSLRNIPVVAAMTRKIEKLSPRAVVLNYTNPMASLTATMCQLSNLRVVGLCHGLIEVYRVLQRLFNVEKDDLSLNIGGVNHFFWVLDFTVKGKPGYPLLRKRLGRKSLDDVLHEGTMDAIGFHSHHAFCGMLLQEYGVLPYVGDRHTCEFLPGYITPNEEALKRFKLHRSSAKARMMGHARQRKRTLQFANGKLPAPKRSHETAADIMAAFLGGKPFVDVVNLPNTGQIDNLPRGAVVETLGQIDPLGFRAINVGPMPETLRLLVEPQCVVQNLIVEAALEGSKEKALEALLLDPLCAHLTPREIRAMGKDLMSATKKWLPHMG